MNIIDRFKKDKKFRVKAVIVIVLMIYFFASYGGDKKEATSQEVCDQYNDGIGGACGWPAELGIASAKCMELTLMFKPQTSKVTGCIASKCGMGRSAAEIAVWDLLDEYGCFSCVPNGLYTTDGEKCCGTYESIVYKDGYNYFCRALQPGEEEVSKCNSAEAGIAKILDGLGLKDIGTCKTKYNLVIFGGGFLAVMMVMVML